MLLWEPNQPIRAELINILMSRQKKGKQLVFILLYTLYIILNRNNVNGHVRPHVGILCPDQSHIRFIWTTKNNIKYRIMVPLKK